jgi:hypothetical protein
VIVNQRHRYLMMGVLRGAVRLQLKEKLLDTFGASTEAATIFV